MKTIFLVPLLFIGVALGQSLDCKTCDQDPNVKVTKLSKCEMDKLQVAKDHLEEVKEQILVDHGKPVSGGTSVFGTGGTYYCGSKVPYDSYELLDSGFVVRITKYWDYSCNGGFTRIRTLQLGK